MDAVNVASRIQPLARPGGICISSHVYEQVKNEFEFPLLLLGPQTLKNIAFPIKVYEVRLPWEPISGTQNDGLDRLRLAILPLDNISPDPADGYFADGMTEELISKVSRIRGLRVIARTSALHCKATEKTIAEIGRELSVGTILEGSVRKSGDRIRISIQLIDARRFTTLRGRFCCERLAFLGSRFSPLRSVDERPTIHLDP